MVPPKVYPDPQRDRVLWTGIVIAVLVLAAIVLATLSLNRTIQGAGSFTGKIIAKEFTPAPAQEITVGAGGLQSTRIDGEYLLKVETPDGVQGGRFLLRYPDPLKWGRKSNVRRVRLSL